MSLFFEYGNRLLIPAWRSFSEAEKLAELDSVGKRQNPIPKLSLILDDWVDNPTVALAGEIISAAATLGNKEFPEYAEAKSFLELYITPTSSMSHILYSEAVDDEPFISKIEKGISRQFDSLLDNNAGDSIQQLWSHLNEHARREKLKQAKALSNEQLSNPIIWVDRARLYTIEGQFKKAERCMRIALSIDPNNRFALRAATTLFEHLDDAPQAIHYLRKTNRTKHDPWLISAHIAISSSIQRFSPFLKNGRELVDSKQISASNITELASSIATEEYKSGSVKKSRSYFETSLQKPNENAIAQLEWVSLRDHRFPFNPANYRKDVPHPFEANAMDSLSNGRWEDALRFAFKWFLDTPYNRLSLLLCIYLLISLFEKYEEAIIFCYGGLRIHHNDSILINNLIYCYAMLNRQKEAQAKSLIKKYKAIDFNELDTSNQIAYFATLGLVSFRNDDIEIGREFYTSALAIAEEAKDEVSGSIALINFARELVLSEQPDKDKYISRVSKVNSASKNLFVILTSTRFLHSYSYQAGQIEDYKR